MKKLSLILLLLVITISTAQSNKQHGYYQEAIDKTSKGVETVYSDGKEAAKTIYLDLKQVAPKISQGLEEIAKGLKVGVNNVWNILVKQQKVWSIGYLILTIASIINWAVFYRKSLARAVTLKTADVEYVTLSRDILIDIPNPAYDDYYKDRPNDRRSQKTIKAPSGGKEEYLSPKIPVTIAAPLPAFGVFLQCLHLAGCIGMSALSIYHFSDMLTGFINPEYGAIKTVVNIVQCLK